jgi:hypothetical protein
VAAGVLAVLAVLAVLSVLVVPALGQGTGEFGDVTVRLSSR